MGVTLVYDQMQIYFELLDISKFIYYIWKTTDMQIVNRKLDSD